MNAVFFLKPVSLIFVGWQSLSFRFWFSPSVAIFYNGMFLYAQILEDKDGKM